MKQTEHTYTEAGYKVARAIQTGNAARARAALQNFRLLLALESATDKPEALRLYGLGYSEAQR